MNPMSECVYLALLPVLLWYCSIGALTATTLVDQPGWAYNWWALPTYAFWPLFAPWVFGLMLRNQIRRTVNQVEDR